jgi:hypothetical protein
MNSEFEEHPETDRALQRYLGSDKYRYRTKKGADGSTRHIVAKKHYGDFWLEETLKDDELESLDPEEAATFIFHWISLKRAMRRRVAVVTTPLMVSLIALLIIDAYISLDFQNLYLVAVTYIAGFAGLFLVIKTERSVDAHVYATCPNFISVLQKIKDSKKDKYEKREIENRIKRLQAIHSSI